MPLSHWEKRISFHLIRICFQHSILYRIQPSKSKIDLFEISPSLKNTRDLYITLWESAVRVKRLVHIIRCILQQWHCETTFVGLNTCIFLTFFETSKPYISATIHPHSVQIDSYRHYTPRPICLYPAVTCTTFIAQDISLQSPNKTGFLIFSLLPPLF